MGTAGLAGQPSIINQKGVQPPREPEPGTTVPSRKSQAMIRRGYAPSYGVMR